MTTSATSATHPTTARPSLVPPPGYFAPLGELAARLDPADRAAVADLVLRFEWCYDTRDYAALSDMLTDDMVIDHLWGYREGRDAVLTLLKDWEWANAGLRHQGINLVVWGEPDGTAAAMSYLFGVTMRGALTVPPDADTGPDTGADTGAHDGDAAPAPAFERPAGHGLVVDRFRREPDGLWRMTSRTIDQMYIDPAFLPDDDARRWFSLSADERRAAHDKPAGWLPA